MAKCSNLTFVTSTAPFSIDWEGRDQDEVSTRRRVATASMESGVPKHFSSDNGVSAGLLKILCINTLYPIIILVLSNRTLYLERKAIKDTVSLISGFDKKSAFRTARS